MNLNLHNVCETNWPTEVKFERGVFSLPVTYANIYCTFIRSMSPCFADKETEA